MVEGFVFGAITGAGVVMVAMPWAIHCVVDAFLKSIVRNSHGG